MRNLLIVSVALAAVAASSASAEDLACPGTVTPEFVTSLGDPAAWLSPGQTAHRPAGLTILGQPVAYVIVTRAGGDAAGAVTEVQYRLQGATRPYGERYSVAVRKAFDKGFPGSDCGAQNTSCSMGFNASAAGRLTDAELSEGDFSIGKDAHGDGLALVKADGDLANADPVFLDCLYQPPK